ncbi:hypothetical protein HIM_08307 [Hirsutella minnesotensis 3608]|uniref:G-protein coupled receptors family 2 profile 2 domain-containing protein n=1 Tax=Hirsutella minnesotensis 3608 TaxID=1043627 RepID=A0A0F7ZH98_9HYPO|nr:hypothetical protein HIM_08307 [Hirsutella minnesotensis 3608]
MHSHASHASHDDASLTERQVDVLITIERTGAGLSMIAITLTILSFIAFKKLRTTPNLFLVFASIANAGASIASMIGYDGLRLGENSVLCQAQAFIFECFMQSDPWWSFAMAFNVYLVFFHNADPASFRKYVWAYCLVCFGGPLIPAIVLVSIRGDLRVPVYGDAALWCWIGHNWSLVRLYSYYIPIWICIFLSFTIYVAVGYRVFQHRNKLLNMSLGENPNDKAQDIPASRLGTARNNSAEESLTRRKDAYGTVVTEIQITSALPNADSDTDGAVHGRHALGNLTYSPSWAHGVQEDSTIHAHRHQCQTTCSSDSPPPQRSGVIGRLKMKLTESCAKLNRLDPVKMAYLRTSFIFAFAVLITWIPSSANRLWSLTNGGQISFGLSVASGCVLPLQGVWNAIIYLTTS